MVYLFLLIFRHFHHGCGRIRWKEIQHQPLWHFLFYDRCMTVRSPERDMGIFFLSCSPESISCTPDKKISLRQWEIDHVLKCNFIDLSFNFLKNCRVNIAVMRVLFILAVFQYWYRNSTNTRASKSKRWLAWLGYSAAVVLSVSSFWTLWFINWILIAWENGSVAWERVKCINCESTTVNESKQPCTTYFLYQVTHTGACRAENYVHSSNFTMYFQGYFEPC